MNTFTVMDLNIGKILKMTFYNGYRVFRRGKRMKMRKKANFVGLVLAILVFLSLRSTKKDNTNSYKHLGEKTPPETYKLLGVKELPLVKRHYNLNFSKFYRFRSRSNNLIHDDLARHWNVPIQDLNPRGHNSSTRTDIKTTTLPNKMTFFKNRTKRITSYDHDFLISSSACSRSKPLLLLVLCISKYDHEATRQIIRKTWGSVSFTKTWHPSSTSIDDVRVMFVLGRSTLDQTQNRAIQEEVRQYGDIIVADFVDSYYNLTRKVTVGLRWVEKYCNDTKFILKVDEDTFIHVKNLVSYLTNFKVPDHGVVIGHIYPKPRVGRIGKWALDKSIYPYAYYPAYVSGNSYVISGNIVSLMTDTIDYFPYLFIEDVTITGIVRRAINASLYNDDGFTFFARPPPKLCDFHNDRIKSATKTSDTMKTSIWQALQWSFDKCKFIERQSRRKMNNKLHPLF